MTFYVVSQGWSSEINATRSEGICFARPSTNWTQLTICVVVSQPLEFSQPGLLKVSPCCFGFQFDKRFMFIIITQFIFVNVIGSAGFRLRSVFFSFVFSTKEW